MQVQVLETPSVATQPMAVVPKRDPKSLEAMLEKLFAAGAVFNFGQALPPDVKSRKYEPTQPVLSGAVRISTAHDGGAWIGFTLASGIQCRTKSGEDAKRLRELTQSPEVLAQGRLGNVGVHLDPVLPLGGFLN